MSRFCDGAFCADGGIVVVGFNEDVLGMILAHRVGFGQGDALLFGLLDVACHFGVAHAAVLHDGLLAHFFNNNAVGDVLTDGGRRILMLGLCAMTASISLSVAWMLRRLPAWRIRDWLIIVPKPVGAARWRPFVCLSAWFDVPAPRLVLLGGG